MLNGSVGEPREGSQWWGGVGWAWWLLRLRFKQSSWRCRVYQMRNDAANSGNNPNTWGWQESGSLATKARFSVCNDFFRNERATKTHTFRDPWSPAGPSSTCIQKPKSAVEAFRLSAKIPYQLYQTASRKILLWMAPPYKKVGFFFLNCNTSITLTCTH